VGLRENEIEYMEVNTGLPRGFTSSATMCTRLSTKLDRKYVEARCETAR
jgi:hypothetical protein